MNWGELVAIGLSTLSLVISGIALGWNIYRDVALKARVRVRFGVYKLHGTTGSTPPMLSVVATNFGPGTVTVGMVAGRRAPLWRRLLRRAEQFVVVHDFENPMNHPLPKKLEVGDKIDVFFRYDEACFLKEAPTHVGIADSFGRVHWARRSDVREALAQFRRDRAAGHLPKRISLGAHTAPDQS